MGRLKKLTILPILLIIISLATFTSLAIWDNAKKDVTYTVDIGEWQTPITGVVFDGITVPYDGTEHSIIATLPREDLSVSYTIEKQGTNESFSEGNSATNVGKYEIIATVVGDGFLSAEYSALLIINPIQIPNLVFEGLTATFDNLPKSLELIGLPEELKVEYAGNNKSEVGEHTVTATISYQDNVPQNYVIPNPLQAELVIKPIEITVIFDNYDEIIYNGNPHYITATLSGNLIDSDSNGTLDTAEELGFALSDNGKSDAGEYVAIATIRSGNYVLVGDTSRAYIIQKANMTGVIFQDVSVNYDGMPHYVTALGYPKGSIISYRIDGEEGNSGIDYRDGGYVVTLECVNANYNTYIASATLTINKIDISGLELKDKVVTYDKNPHILELLNVPNGVTVSWDVVGYTDVGTYYPIATLSGNNYNTLVYNEDNLARKSLTINPAELTDVALGSIVTIYNGKAQYLPLTTNGAKVLYSLDNGNTYNETYSLIDAKQEAYSVLAKFSKPNYNDKTISATLKIDKANGIISSNSNYLYKYIGTAIDLLSNSTISTNHTEKPLTYAVSGGSSLINAGTYTVTLNIEESTNYLGFSKEITVVIELNNRVITAPASRESVYNGSVVEYKEKVGGNTSELTDSSYTYTFTKEGVVVTEIKDAGTYIIQITIAQTTSYKAVTVHTTYLVKKAAVTITADDVQKTVYDKSEKQIKVDSVTNNINYICAPASVTEAGTHNIKIIVEETINFMSAEKAVTLIIEKASRTNSLPNTGMFVVEKNTKTYDGSYYSYTFIGEVRDGVTYDIYGGAIEEYADGVVTYNTNNFRAAGEYVVHTYIAETANYKKSELMPTTVTFKINKAEVKFVSKIGTEDNRTQSSQYTKSGQSILFESNSDGRITYTSQLGNGLQSNPSFVDVGSYEVTISQEEGTNHKAGSTTFTLEITQKRINIIMATTRLEYRQTVEEAVVFSWIIDPRTPLLSGDKLEDNVTEIKKQLKLGDKVITDFDNLDAKTYTVTGAFDSKNYQLSISEGQLIISPMMLDSVVFGEVTGGETYNGEVKSVTAKAQKLGATAETILDVKYSKALVRDVGEYVAYVTQLIDGNYRLSAEALETQKSFVIKPASLSLKNKNVSQIYLSTSEPVATAQDGAIFGTDEVRITLDPWTSMNYNNLNVGKYYYDIKISNQNYELTDSEFALDVTPLDISGKLSFIGITEQYNMAPKAIAVKYDNLDNWLTTFGNQISITYINNNQTNVGEYTVTATFSVTANFVALAPLFADIKIEPKQLDSITFGEIEGGTTYSGLEKRVGVSYSGILGIDNPQVILSFKNEAGEIVPLKAAGTYTAAVASLGNNNYTLPNTLPDEKSYTIIPKTLYFSVTRSRSLVFDGTNLGITNVAISGGLVSGDTCEISLNNALNVNVGTYTATVTLNNPNYTVNNATNLEYAITQATFDTNSIIFTNETVTYNGDIQRLSISTALPNGLNVSYTNNDNKDVGVYTVTASFTESSGLDNYKDIADKQATLTIKKKNINVNVTSIQIEKGETATLTCAVEGAYEPLTFELGIYSGETLIETDISLLEVGAYTIKVKVQDLSNYNITYTDGTLEIVIKAIK